MSMNEYSICYLCYYYCYRYCRCCCSINNQVSKCLLTYIWVGFSFFIFLYSMIDVCVCVYGPCAWYKYILFYKVTCINTRATGLHYTGKEQQGYKRDYSLKLTKMSCTRVGWIHVFFNRVLHQRTVGATSPIVFLNGLDKLRKTKIGFFMDFS